jgi:hypothetical protein
VLAKLTTERVIEDFAHRRPLLMPLPLQTNPERLMEKAGR